MKDDAVKIDWIVGLAVLLLVSGCSRLPSEADGRAHIESKIEKQSNGLIRLVSFEKTNAVRSEFMGNDLYELEFTLEIEFLEDCMWSTGMFGWSGDFIASAEMPEEDSYADMWATAVGQRRMSKGERKTISGQLVYQNAERGWRLISG